MVQTPMKIKTRNFVLDGSEKMDLKKWPTKTKALYESDKDYDSTIAEHVQQLSRFQEVLYAHHRYAVLIIFQGMDASGKDGMIKHVMSGLNPQGCQVFTFKQPSVDELQHDFLWRTVCRLPQRGHIGVFNRSYYEEVLIVRIHPAVLQGEFLPDELVDDGIWKDRYRSIRDFERHLYRNGTRVLKFFLHLSKKEQRDRFLSRLEEPEKNWKFSEADIAEREYWKDYVHAYERCLEATASDVAPWYIVPADDKKNARLIVSGIIHDAMSTLTLSYPELALPRGNRLKKIRKQLESE